MGSAMDDAVRVGIIGCGKIADVHLEVITTSPVARLVGVYDRDRRMANQAAQRFGVPAFDSLERWYAEARPEVVYITTLPTSHSELATQALVRGCHVYVEKPFAMSFQEAKRVLDLAREMKKIVVCGYNALYCRVMERARQQIQSGQIGGRPFLIESYYAYPTEGTEYVRAMTGQPDHWVLSLPGGHIQNVISHALAPIAEWMEGESPRVEVVAYSSWRYHNEGSRTAPTELRAICYDGYNVTGMVVVSSRLAPPHFMAVNYRGANGDLWLDLSAQSLFVREAKPHKSYLNYVLPNWRRGNQLRREAWLNLWELIRGRNHVRSGLICLTERFYHAVRANRPSPTPDELILREMAMLDQIVEAIQSLSRGS